MLEAESLSRVQNKAFPGPGQDKATSDQALVDTGKHLLSPEGRQWGAGTVGFTEPQGDAEVRTLEVSKRLKEPVSGVSAPECLASWPSA